MVRDGAARSCSAVKPQTIDSVLTEIGAQITRDGSAARKLFISIAAGIPIARIQARWAPSARVIRVMPNAPAMVGRGDGGAGPRRAPPPRPTRPSRCSIFRAVGDAVALSDEALLDAVTALSGSGPAYVYLFVKALADAGVDAGLAGEARACEMALKTIVRRGRANAPVEDAPVEELIRIVASPGGTTEAALRSFAANGFPDVVAAAIKAAADRSRELGQ